MTEHKSEMFDGAGPPAPAQGGLPDVWQLRLDAIAMMARNLIDERAEGCALLRRAAGAITSYQLEAMVLDGDVDEEDTGARDDILEAIGAFLARVDPP